MAMFDRTSSSASSTPSSSWTSSWPSPLPSRSPSVREQGEAIAEQTLFVAVSRQVYDSKSVLLWALKNRGNNQICIIHVHQPDKEISVGLGKVPIDHIDNKNLIDAHRVAERERLSKKLDKHLQFCSQRGVKARTIYIEMDSIQDGIVKLITDQKIGKLVMGAASDKRLSKDMIEIVSEKANYVRQRAPGYCHILFVCKKFLIHTREATEKIGSLNPAPSYEIGGLSSPESRIEKSDLMVVQLERRLESVMEHMENYKKERDARLESAMVQVEKYKKERDVIQMERDNAIKQVQVVRHQLMNGVSCVGFPTFCYELPLEEIEKATNKFDPVLKIGEDAYGNIYKGFLNLKVAVKVPHPSSSSSPQEFQQEVEIMCKLRHPNIVNLISICPESKALIYEYCANGNLEDQLNSKVEGSPLPWQTRLRIAIELCIVLMFLHSHKPHPIFHGDIRPENIHLDSKYTCKLSNFRASSAIASGTFSLEDTVKFHRSDSRAISNAYSTDPEYFATGELTTRSDVYSYGLMLLRLLTGKPALKLTRQVQRAVDTDELSTLLDSSAGWPLERAKQLAALALRCCQMTSDKRPDLKPDVWKVLESIHEGVI